MTHPKVISPNLKYTLGQGVDISIVCKTTYSIKQPSSIENVVEQPVEAGV